MKKWNLVSNIETLDIINLFKGYSKSLLESSDNKLIGYLEFDLIDNNIVYSFRVKNNSNNYIFDVKVFVVIVLNLNGNLKLNVNFMNGTDTYFITESHLEAEIDKIIQSEKMANYIGYLMSLSLKHKV